MVAKSKGKTFKMRAGAFKNKIGSRDSGKSVKTLSTKELQDMLARIKGPGKVRRRDRNIIERELNVRGFDVTTIG